MAVTPERVREIKSVPEFYAGVSVFITGGTGFLGKIIIEKILYSCPKVENIYLLVREKQENTAKERIKALLECPVFDRLREERPQDLDKMVPIAGDILLPNLGINPDDEQRLIDKVSVVIHSAATVKFNEPLSVALKANVEGTRMVLELCKRMKSLKAFIHMSTAFCNAIDNVVEEKLYPPLMELENAYEMANDLGQKITTQDLCGKPNTYTFTKALTENLVKDLHDDIPTVIFRPSIVTPSISEPISGWVENYYGATGVLTAIGKGYCRLMIGSRHNVPDIVPVDYVSNAVVVAAAKFCRSGEVQVINYSSSSCNPASMGTLSEYFSEDCVRYSFNDFPYPYAFGIESEWLIFILVLMFEMIPAYIADWWLYLRGKSQKYVKLQSRVETMRQILGYFTRRSWMIHTENIFTMISEMSTEDARTFPCNPRDICWKEYTTTFFYGVRKYLLKK